MSLTLSEPCCYWFLDLYMFIDEKLYSADQACVSLCVSSDESEVHIDYEDTFTDSDGGAERHDDKPEETHGRMNEEVDGAAYQKEKMSQEQQETGFSVVVEEEHQGQRRKQEGRGEVMKFEEGVEGREKDEEQAVQDFIGHPAWEQESREVVRTDAAAATEAPVSLLSQKHMFWFPSEAFQEGGLPVSTNPVTQITQRASGAQSEESQEHESQERNQHFVDGDDQDHEAVDHEDSRHDQDEDDHDDHVKHYVPAQRDDLDRRDSHERHDDDDHYNVDEHVDDRSQEHDDRDDIRGKQEIYENREGVTDDRYDDDDDDELEHLHGSQEHPDHDDNHDGEEHYDLDADDNDHYTIDNDHEHDDHDSYENHDSHERESDRQHVIFSIATDQRQNITQKRAGGRKATTDETWLDGYPVVPEETEKDDSSTERVRPELRDRGTAAKSTDRPGQVEIRRPATYTSSPQEPESPTAEPEEMWAGFIPTDSVEPSDSPSYSDTLDYDTQQAAPTHTSLGDLTEQPFLGHGPAPPVHNSDILTGVMEEHTMHNLPSETGERGEVEGERGQTICTDEKCPPRPPNSSSQGPKVAAILVALFAVAAAVIVGVWCYRRQQQKSSLYEMNGKGQSQSRQGQQIEMQQKV